MRQIDCEITIAYLAVFKQISFSSFERSIISKYFLSSSITKFVRILGKKAIASNNKINYSSSIGIF